MDMTEVFARIGANRLNNDCVERSKEVVCGKTRTLSQMIKQLNLGVSAYAYSPLSRFRGWSELEPNIRAG